MPSSTRTSLPAAAPVRRHRLAGAVVAAGLTLFLTGCGSGPDPADPAAGAAAEVDVVEAVQSLDAAFGTADAPSPEEARREYEAWLAGRTAAADPTDPASGDPASHPNGATERPGETAPQPATALAVGDCLDHLPTGAEDTAADIAAVDCAGEHLVEVYRAVTLAPLGPDYPVFTDLVEVTQEGCGNGFLEYVGGTVIDTAVAFDAVTPSKDSWADGDTTALCYAYPVSLAPFTGTLQGSSQ
ncbi:septum formation family protein [Nakamurella deserti]|uniref:septum formation family protein n=1 Tax=Nakamurella deserti TaxID=2164074 RepID=UPI000DBE524B|nr:septum formation family protein [Nakamurella deserti]